jgi:uncharacterized protein (DUF488 family)
MPCGAIVPSDAVTPSHVLYTIGHSTHPIATFLELLTARQVALLIDVRSYPSSRRWPQFNQAALQQSVAAAGIEYRWLAALGGRRQAKAPASPHTAWKVAAFRAYADYADTPEWAAGCAELTRLAAARPTAIMCAEGLWWQCHRRIIADHLVVAEPRVWSVRHILPDGKLADHALPDFARWRDGHLVYDGGQPALSGGQDCRRVRC